MTDDLGVIVAARDLIAKMRASTPEQRLEVFVFIESAYCPECGREQPEGWNDCMCWSEE